MTPQKVATKVQCSLLQNETTTSPSDQNNGHWHYFAFYQRASL